ncbi:MAG: hypothetical protein P4L33_10620 [Capsulimonadaceae bacterium]|nr:hypothetical protein [Capsulimonadaceae bacterium]
MNENPRNQSSTNGQPVGKRSPLASIATFFKFRRLVHQYATSLRFVIGTELRLVMGKPREAGPQRFDIIDYPGLFPEIPQAEDIVNTVARTILKDANSRLQPLRIAWEGTMTSAEQTFKEGVSACEKSVGLLPEPTPTEGDQMISESRKAEIESDYRRHVASRFLFLAAGATIAFFELCTLASALLSHYEPPVETGTLISTWVIAAMIEATLVWLADRGVLPVLRYITHIRGYDSSSDVPPEIRAGNVACFIAAFVISYFVAAVRGDSVRTGGVEDIAVTVLATVGLPLLAAGTAAAFRVAAKARDEIAAIADKRSIARKEAVGLKAMKRDEAARKASIKALGPTMTNVSGSIDDLRENACAEILTDPVVKRQIHEAAERIARIEIDPSAHASRTMPERRFDIERTWEPPIDTEWKEI